MYLQRALSKALQRSLDAFPAVLATGPRQSGKTPFLRHEVGERYRYVSFDDPLERDFARTDPYGFLRAFDDSPTLLDEVQYVPELPPNPRGRPVAGLLRRTVWPILAANTSWSFGDMSLPLRDPHRHTYGEYCSWSEDQRYELIDGMAYAMAPAPTRQHQRLTFELAREIANGLGKSGCEVNVAPFDVRLPDGDEADEDIDTVVQPDISVVCDPSKLDDGGCRGAPDWIIEVLSADSAGNDQVRKLALYERHGVKEYWLVHPVDRVVTIYRLEEGVYGRPQVSELEGRSGCRACPDAEVDWERVVKGLPAPSGVG